MEETRMKVKSGKLKGNNRCTFRRERKIETDGNKNVTYDKVSIQKSAIMLHMAARKLFWIADEAKEIFEKIITKEDPKGYEKEIYSLLKRCRASMGSETTDPEEFLIDLFKFLDEEHVREYVKKRYQEIDFLTEETAKLQGEVAADQVTRYICDEERIPDYYPAETLPIYGIDVEVKPDMVFHNNDGSLEVVKICCRKPDISQTGKKKDSSVTNCMELYAMWRYGKIMALQDDQIIKASYYFLRREDDRSDNLVKDFFPKEVEDEKKPGKYRISNGKNVVSMIGAANDGYWDGLYGPQFDEYIKGEQCSGSTCEHCDFYALCNYNKAPLISEDEKGKKKISDISLTPEQEAAVNFREGVVRINAGAGAGKTLVVTLRTTMMLSEGIDKILLITFTNAGADEMRERIEMYTSEFGITPTQDDLFCTTFNSFGNEIIKEEFERFGFDTPPRVIDEIERKAIITDILRKKVLKGLDYKNYDMNFPYIKGALIAASEAFRLIKKEHLSIYDADRLKTLMIQNGFDVSIHHPDAYQELLNAYDEFDNRLRSEALIEFQDQERLLFELLDIDPYYFEKLGYKHIIVDEYQDTSENQNEIVKKLVECDSFESLMVVGDDSQSIFSFRDANPENILDFFDLLGVDGQDIYIMENHRSTPEILEFANKLNARNTMRIEKDLIATRPHGIKPIVRGFHKKADEYAYIAEKIKQKLEEGFHTEDIAVIAATRNELLSIASVLAEEKIETAICCPEPMLENSRVLGSIALCHMLQDSTDTQDIIEYENCIRDGALLEMSDADIKDIIEADKAMIEAFQLLSEDEKAKQVDAMIDEITKGDFIAENFAERLKRFVLAEDKFQYADRFVQFGGEAIKREGNFSGVTLATAHSSKGLEWPVIINSVTKYDRARSGRKELEERRLFFVSATRARDELIVTGLYKLSGGKGDSLVYNTLLMDAYDILGCEFDPVDHSKEEKKGEKKAS